MIGSMGEAWFLVWIGFIGGFAAGSSLALYFWHRAIRKDVKVNR